MNRPLAASLGAAWPPVLALLVIVLLVEIAGRSDIGNGLVVIPFTAMVASAASLVTDDDVWRDAVIPTMQAAALAFVVAVPVGALVGFAVWRWRLVREAVSPYLTVVPALPLVALYPLLVVLFGTGRLPLVIVAAVGAFVPVATQTTAGLDGLNPTHLRLADALRMPLLARVRSIYAPTLGRALLTAARLAAAYSLIVVIGSELILSTRGLGRMIRLSYDSFDLDTMYGAILIVIALVSLVYAVIAVLQRRLLRWEVSTR